MSTDSSPATRRGVRRGIYVLPALFTVGSADHLLDDSLFMAARWEAYGNESELAVYPDCIHAFTAFPTELGKRANERIDGFLERVLA